MRQKRKRMGGTSLIASRKLKRQKQAAVFLNPGQRAAQNQKKPSHSTTRMKPQRSQAETERRRKRKERSIKHRDRLNKERSTIFGTYHLLTGCCFYKQEAALGGREWYCHAAQLARMSQTTKLQTVQDQLRHNPSGSMTLLGVPDVCRKCVTHYFNIKVTTQTHFICSAYDLCILLN